MGANIIHLKKCKESKDFELSSSFSTETNLEKVKIKRYFATLLQVITKAMQTNYEFSDSPPRSIVCSDVVINIFVVLLKRDVNIHKIRRTCEKAAIFYTESLKLLHYCLNEIKLRQIMDIKRLVYLKTIGEYSITDDDCNNDHDHESPLSLKIYPADTTTEMEYDDNEEECDSLSAKSSESNESEHSMIPSPTIFNSSIIYKTIHVLKHVIQNLIQCTLEFEDTKVSVNHLCMLMYSIYSVYEIKGDLFVKQIVSMLSDCVEDFFSNPSRPCSTQSISHQLIEMSILCKVYIYIFSKTMDSHDISTICFESLDFECTQDFDEQFHNEMDFDDLGTHPYYNQLVDQLST